MSEKQNERLASLETKVGLLLELLKEIKEDLKHSPSREEYDSALDRISKLEESDKKILWKVAIGSGSLAVILGILAELLRYGFK